MANRLGRRLQSIGEISVKVVKVAKPVSAHAHRLGVHKRTDGAESLGRLVNAQLLNCEPAFFTDFPDERRPWRLAQFHMAANLKVYAKPLVAMEQHLGFTHVGADDESADGQVVLSRLSMNVGHSPNLPAASPRLALARRDVNLRQSDAHG